MNHHNFSEITQLETKNIKNLSAAECARALATIVNKLRIDSLIAQKNQILSSEKIREFIIFLNKNLEEKRKVQILFNRILEIFDFNSLLIQTGLSKPHGFLRELGSRIIEKIIPKHSVRPNFKDLLFFIFPNEHDASFLKKLSFKEYNSLLTVFDPDLKNPEAGVEFLKKKFFQRAVDSLIVLSAEVLIVYESPLIKDIRWNFKKQEEHHPFLELNKFLHQEELSLKTYSSFLKQQKIKQEFLDIHKKCLRDLKRIGDHLEGGGLSADLVYHIEILGLYLERINSLVNLCFFNDIEKSHEKILDFVSILILDEQKRRSTHVLFEENIHFLARKIVDHSGEKGDDYIARNTLERFTLFKAALGAGLLTAFTTLFKIILYNLNAAFFFQGFFAALNYAGSFILMQFLHLTLATKQPAMTAASLARRMSQSKNNFSELRKEIKNVLKSQALAALGNITAVVPMSYCIFLAWESFFHTKIMTKNEALELISAHDPFQSLTVFYALLTGVFLSSAGIVHGWVENWMVFRGLPQLLSDSFLVENFLSLERRKKLSIWLEKNLASIIANMVLGILLAFSPIVGKIFALPLEVRHVTLAAGSLTFAISTLGIEKVADPILWPCISGIIVILGINILTSFALSMWLALKAKGLPWYYLKRVFKNHD
jgi:site-specific recombinase